MFVSSPDRMRDAEAIAVAFTKAGMAIGKLALQSITTAGEPQVVVGPKEGDKNNTEHNALSRSLMLESKSGQRRPLDSDSSSN